MQKFLITLVMLLSLALSASADKKPKAEREAWMKEMQQYKTDFLVKKLELTDEQKARFVPLYNRMDSEIRNVVESSRNLTDEVRKKGLAATDDDLLRAASSQWECKSREAQIETRYFGEFKKILTPRQLLKLKDAERDFMKNLMKKHREHRRSKRPARQATK